MTREEIEKATQEFLANGGQIQYLDSEKEIVSNKLVGYGYASNGASTKYGYDTTAYASPKQPN